MKRSIVWRCAITVALAQVGSYVIIGTIAITSGFRPVFDAWTARAADTLRAHHQLIREIADQQGPDVASAAAAKLSVAEIRHQVVHPADVRWRDDYMGMAGEEWRSLAEARDGPSLRNGELRWITFPVASRDQAGTGAPIVVLSSARWPAERLIRTDPAGVAFWVGCGLLLTALAGGLVATWFTRPILRLRASVTHFAAGELDSRPPQRLQSRRDELGDLARDLARMEDRIATLVNAQRELLDDVAHELRSPLARMNIAVELAERTHDQSKSPDSDESGRLLARIRRESERLADMIDRLLQLSSLEHQIDDHERTAIDLSRLTREVVDDCNFEARAADRIVNILADQDVRVLGNEDMLRTAIENIVRNAMRYTPAGQSVDVSLCSAADQRDRVLITIRDHGRGVSEDALPKLFQPFYRVESDRNAESGGAGLGLALADRAVRAHAGTITARNHADGGLEFIIDLPIHIPGG
jgi:signal transduction histidine kinase